MATVIEAYCDESGIHDGAAKCVVVCWVATARHWEQFEERWKRASRGVDFTERGFLLATNSVSVFSRTIDGTTMKCVHIY